jgi:4,5-DOPA dioxygenase extradiol
VDPKGLSAAAREAAMVSKRLPNTEMSMNKAPVLFISHGAPTFALEPGLLGPRLTALGERLSEISAVLVVSAHWQTRGVHVMSTAAPETVHDFGGFPAALYKLQYPAPGAPGLATEAGRLLSEAGFAVRFDDRRGLDHGAWVPLRFLFPRANVPVFQVSMPYDLDALGALRLGKALAPLRERGVMIVGSGSLTHNLYEFRQSASPEATYAREFSDWIRQGVLRGDFNALARYRQSAPHAERAHPTDDHFLPLLVAQGASDGSEAVDAIEGGITHGVLSMDSFAWGLSPGPITAALARLLHRLRAKPVRVFRRHERPHKWPVMGPNEE